MPIYANGEGSLVYVTPDPSPTAQNGSLDDPLWFHDKSINPSGLNHDLCRVAQMVDLV